MTTATGSNNVLHDDFDMARIMGKDIREVAQDYSINWSSAYPIINDNWEVVGIVDGNWPDSFNNGNWQVVEDTFVVGDKNLLISYAEAIDANEDSNA